jgi:hypothetical protein
MAWKYEREVPHPTVWRAIVSTGFEFCREGTVQYSWHRSDGRLRISLETVADREGVAHFLRQRKAVVGYANPLHRDGLGVGVLGEANCPPLRGFERVFVLSFRATPRVAHVLEVETANGRPAWEVGRRLNERTGMYEPACRYVGIDDWLRGTFLTWHVGYLAQ